LLSESKNLTPGAHLTQFDEQLMALKADAMQFTAPKVWTNDFWNELREVERGLDAYKMEYFIDGSQIDGIQEVMDGMRRKFDEIVRNYNGQLTCGCGC
jgi:hypothetical protein